MKSTSFSVCRVKDAEPLRLKIPILASAMDGVVDVHFAIAMNNWAVSPF